MHPGIIFFLVILGSVLFHIFTPWYWTDVASNWGGMDDTITLTFWVGGGVFIAVCLFMIYCVFKFSYKKESKAEYKPEDKKLEFRLTALTALGVIALLAPGLVVWNKYVTVPDNALKIEVVAYQWGWNYRLPGDDGILGTTDIKLINDANKYGDVVVLLNSDAWLRNKKGKEFLSFDERKIIMKNIKGVLDVLAFDDSDKSCVDGIMKAKNCFKIISCLFC